jgi:hypothetical protein
MTLVSRRIVVIICKQDQLSIMLLLCPLVTCRYIKFIEKFTCYGSLSCPCSTDIKTRIAEFCYEGYT